MSTVLHSNFGMWFKIRIEHDEQAVSALIVHKVGPKHTEEQEQEILKSKF